MNRDRAVPPFVQGLTGIHPGMLMDAPAFQHIAEELRSRLEGRVLVAHDASFDWHFVSAELEEATGRVPDLPRLCTLRLARALVPRLRRRNLDAVAAYYGIPFSSGIARTETRPRLPGLCCVSLTRPPDRGSGIWTG